MLTFNTNITKLYFYIYIDCFMNRGKFIHIELYIIIAFRLKTEMLVFIGVNGSFLRKILLISFNT